MNLLKRILTSLILISILSLSLLINIYFWLTLLIIVAIICFFEFNNFCKKIKSTKKSFIIIVNIICTIYLLIFIYTSFKIYQISLSELIFIILICIFSDSGGYFVGKLVGGKKLSIISPNKTISGSIGSLFASLIPIYLFYFILDTDFLLFKTYNLSILVLISLFLSIICQLGDLFISYFKRKSNVKDTGTLLPGHGGLLDRIDGAIFVLPAAFLINKLFF